jgi:hypothetical protein
MHMTRSAMRVMVGLNVRSTPTFHLFASNACGMRVHGTV